jgi:hypothetical protein
MEKLISRYYLPSVLMGKCDRMAVFRNNIYRSLYSVTISLKNISDNGSQIVSTLFSAELFINSNIKLTKCDVMNHEKLRCFLNFARSLQDLPRAQCVDSLLTRLPAAFQNTRYQMSDQAEKFYSRVI